MVVRVVFGSRAVYNPRALRRYVLRIAVENLHPLRHNNIIVGTTIQIALAMKLVRALYSRPSPYRDYYSDLAGQQ